MKGQCYLAMYETNTLINWKDNVRCVFEVSEKK